MTKDEAFLMLYQMVPSKTAMEILGSIDSDKVDIFGVEGFITHDDGVFEASLDLIFDLSSVQNLSGRERVDMIKIFVEGRAGDNIFFEVYGE